MDKNEAIEVIWAARRDEAVSAERLKAAADLLKHGKHASIILMNLDVFENKPYYEALLKTVFASVVKFAPSAALGAIDRIADTPYYADMLITAFTNAAKHPEHCGAALQRHDLLPEGTFKESIIKTAFYTEATHAVLLDQLEISADLLRTKPYKNDVMKQGYISVAKHNYALTLLPGLSMRETPNYYDALAKQPYKNDVLKQLGSTPESALSMGVAFNYLHEEPAKTRFAALKYLDASRTYNVITEGRAEVYTSTYNGVLDGLLQKLAQEKKTLPEVLSPQQMKKFDVFLEAAASYNRLDDVLKLVPPAKMPGIITSMVQQAGGSKTLDYTFTLSSMMLALKGQPELRHQLEAAVKHAYEHAKSPQEKDRFGLVASAYGNSAPSVSKDMQPFFLGMAAHREYALPSMSTLKRPALVDSKGVCNQLMVFAADEDSKNSYTHFIETYTGKPGWKMTDHGAYVCVSSTDHAGGVPVKLYANKPEYGNHGVEDIQAAVAKAQGGKTPHFQVFVGRGHSYYAREYLKLLTQDMTLVHLGSCGGFQNLGETLRRSPQANVISTQETGSMFVNDPLLASINESIRTKGQVNWHAQQQFLDQVPSEYNHAYLLPHKNIPARMQPRYDALQRAHKNELKALGIPNAKALDAYIRDRNEFTFLKSDGTIEQDEIDVILKAGKLLGKHITVTQNKGDDDIIAVQTGNKITKYHVKLDDEIKSTPRGR